MLCPDFSKNIINMKNIRLFFLLGFLSAAALQAATVSPERAMKAARAFFALREQPDAVLEDRTSATPFSEFYLFAKAGGGFVLIAADDCVSPVLGYSLHGSFSVKGMPDSMLGWFRVYEQQIREARTHRMQSLLKPAAAKRIAEQWADLEQGRAAGQPLATAVAPLMATTWDQGQFYNTYCPYDEANEANVPVGCTATAMAQVMKYWNFPTTGYGSHSYTSTYGPLSADFGSTTYDWSNMPDALTYQSSTDQINAVATLMSHAGIAIDMEYSPYGSNSYITHFGDISASYPSAESAMVRNFKYRPTAHLVSRSIYGDSLFAAIVRSDLDHARPVLTIGHGYDGHIFVIDGYDNAGLFHLNWGWSGFCDGYYAIDNLNPASDGYLSHYDRDNHIIAGLEPSAAFGSDGTLAALSNDEVLGSVSGGGSYSFGSTVTLKASAQAGCKFVRWNDYCNYNPRKVIGTGGADTLTAVFERLEGDTLGYGSMLWLTGWGAGSSELYWGVKFPASAISPDRLFCAGQLYPVVAGNYTMTIYSGPNSRSNTLGSVDFSVTEEQLQQWLSVPLPNPVAVPRNHAVWVTFNYHNATGGNIYPAAVSYSCGSRDAFLWGSNFAVNVTNYENYSLLVRGIFAPNPRAPHTVTLRCNNGTWGNVSGGGTYLLGDTATITATPASARYYFVDWNDGDTHAVRSFVVTCDTTFTANFGKTEGIEAAARLSVAVSAAGGIIRISGAEGASVSVYDVQGRLVGRCLRASAECCSQVPAAGLYLLKIVWPDGSTEIRKIVAR